MKYLITLLFALYLFAPTPGLSAEQDITLTGVVMNNQGQPLKGATIHSADQTTITDTLGYFSLPTLARHNQLLTISHPDYQDEIIAVHLLKPLHITHHEISPVIMSLLVADVTRFVFGGDTSFGRRYIDPDEMTPRDQLPVDNPEALISVDDPVPGSQLVGQYIRPLFQNADWSVLNLETPVTLNPSTPHEEKAFAFFTLPDSLQAINWLGVDYVSLGNNHLYDYLDIGVQDTITSLDALGISHSGAGSNSTQAYSSFHKILNETSYSFLSMTSVSGSQHQINYVASENKAGAADLRDHSALAKAIQRDINEQHIPIAQLHGGKEYTFEPTENFMRHIKFAVSAGAKLVVGHHPHVAQGVGLIDDIVTIHSLGNLIFDQARLETMLGLIARVDMDAVQTRSLRFYPIYIDNFIPKPISGDLANRFLRRIGEFSHAYGALVYPYNNQGWVSFNNEAEIIERSVTINVTIPESGIATVDLRQLADSTASLFKITTENDELSMKIGRDILSHGDFEDWDIDNKALVASRWDTSRASSQICSDDVFKGSAALCSTRSSRNISDSVITFRNRIRVMGESTGEPNKDLSLFAYIKGNNAGQIRVVNRFHSSAGDATFGEEAILHHPGGSFDWQPIISDIRMPVDSTDDITDVENNPRAIRIFIHHSPPLEGDGMAIFDEFAVINWEDLIAGQDLVTPHAKDFLRIHGAPGNYALSLGFRSYQPETSQFVALDLKANNVDALTTDEQSNISITVSLQQHLANNPVVDWWLQATTQDNKQFTYVHPEGWRPGNLRTTTQPLLNIVDFEVFNNQLPQGNYEIKFCIDDNLDNQKDCTWQDTLRIEVQ